jgi:XTP/dITP diphosphohydrolase
MKTVFFATSNPEKAIEVGKILNEFEIGLISKDMDIPEDKTKTQEEIAKDKARHAAKKSGAPSIAEDTGVYFDAFANEDAGKGWPGVNSRDAYMKLGLEGILKKLEGKERSATFKAIVAFCEPGKDKEPIVFEGICRGMLTEKIIGPIIDKMPYDNIFVPEGERQGRTFSQMTKDEKGSYSHRAKAARAFAQWFSKAP